MIKPELDRIVLIKYAKTYVGNIVNGCAKQIRKQDDFYVFWPCTSFPLTGVLH
jgi:hypothetical protein